MSPAELMILVRPPHVRAAPVRNEHPTDLPEQFAVASAFRCVNAKDRHTAGYDRPKPDPGSLRPLTPAGFVGMLDRLSLSKGRSLLDGHSHRVAGSVRQSKWRPAHLQAKQVLHQLGQQMFAQLIHAHQKCHRCIDIRTECTSRYAVL